METTVTFNTPKEFKTFLTKVETMPSMFNRPTRESHIKNMTTSIEKIGVQRGIVIIKTSAFGGGEKLYTGDGQHLRRAILNISDRKLRGHFVVLITTINRIDEIIPFVSKMNSTASNWGMKDYLNSWVTHGLDDYRYLLNKHEETGYGISPLVEAYMNCRGHGNTTFKQGKFKANKEKGNRTVALYKTAVQMGLRDCNSSFLGFVRFIVDHATLDEGYMLSQIKRNAKLFNTKFSREGYLALLRANCKKIV